MALDSPPLPTELRKAACAIETTTGTKATLTSTDAITRLYDPTITYSTEKVDRPKNDISPQGSLPGMRVANCSWGNLLTSASTQPHWLRYLRMAGFADSGYTGAVAGVFKPTFPSVVTGTFATYRPKRFLCATGVVTNGVLTLTRGQAGRWQWTGLGAQEIPDSTSNVTGITYEDIAPLYVGATLSLGTGAKLVVPTVTIDLGNQLEAREDIEAKDSTGSPTGIRSGKIMRVQPTIAMSPEALGLDQRDWYAIRRNMTELALSITLQAGTATGSPKCVITAPKLRLDENTEEDDNGTLRDALTFIPTGDESSAYLTFDFTPAA
ncbi:MAG: hypothetical protein QM754_18555 [Tepidisphaeraceae bacterium]